MSLNAIQNSTIVIGYFVKIDLMLQRHPIQKWICCTVRHVTVNCNDAVLFLVHFTAIQFM